MSSPAASPLAAAQPKRAAGLGCAVLFGLIFAAAGLAAFWFVTLRPVLRASASSGWVETPCVILSSKLETHSDSDGSTYRVDIRYRYEWNGRAHEGDRYDFSTGSTNVGVKRMRAAVRAHPPGLRTLCYVDPSDPASAVLDRDLPRGVWFGALTLLFPAFGFAMIFFVWRGVRKARDIARSPLNAAGPNAYPGPGEPAIVAGETLLKPATGRVGAFVGITLFTLLWNGFLAFFISKACDDFGRGFIGWFLPIFLIPFVLVGLLMIAGALQAFSRLFAPPVEVRLDPSRLRLGARVPFAWRLAGSGVRKLVVRLVAREEATYRQGTNTTTDKSDFFRAVVFESTDALSLMEGRSELILPSASAAPTLASKNNKLVWELVFDGEIPWRANIDDRFTLPMRGPENMPVSAAAPEPAARAGGGFTLWTVDRFSPGETLVFTLAREAGAKPGPVALQLGWFTEGKGTQDAAIAWSAQVADLAPGNDRSFEVPLPDSPWSFSGKLVSVSWRLEVLDADRVPLIGVPLVIAPEGTTVDLPALPPESRLRSFLRGVRPVRQ